jgi:DNA-binding NtrC family response regulator
MSIAPSHSAAPHSNRAIPRLLGESTAFLRLRSLVSSIGTRACTVLVRGESGTGKELIARYLHNCGPRADKPFVPVDCTTLKESLFESQLFGHSKGAFTGADQSTLGFIRSANGGTLFLDEIGEMALSIQAKLLRCIQDRAVVPLGSNATLPVDIRIIAATHRDLKAMVKRGEFREDLYFRLNVVQLIVPPLRERRCDVLPLAEHFLEYFAEIYSEPKKRLSPAAARLLETYAWPGNVRELANVMEQFHILSSGNEILPDDFPSDLQSEAMPESRHIPINLDIPTLDHAEKELVARALVATRGNQSRAAEVLDIDRRRLRRKIRLHGLQSFLHHSS